MSDEVATENGDNWSVFFFESPTELLGQVLVDLFLFIHKIEEAKIPHFMVREAAIIKSAKRRYAKSFGISLRVLRNQADAELLDSELSKLFEREKVQYQKEPVGNRHGWISKGTTNPHWNRQRCESLHQLSNLVVFLAQNNIFDGDYRCYMAHYAVNMLILQEATVPFSNQVAFWDAIRGTALPFQTMMLDS